jgi:hypothetical protein
LVTGYKIGLTRLGLVLSNLKGIDTDMLIMIWMLIEVRIILYLNILIDLIKEQRLSKA